MKMIKGEERGGITYEETEEMKREYNKLRLKVIIFIVCILGVSSLIAFGLTKLLIQSEIGIVVGLIFVVVIVAWACFDVIRHRVSLTKKLYKNDNIVRDDEMNHTKVTDYYTSVEKSIIDINKAREYMKNNIPCRDFEKTCGTHIGCSTCPYYQFEITVLWALEKSDEMYTKNNT